MRASYMFLARMLMLEQRYQAIKKSPRFASEITSGETRKKLRNFLRISYASNAVSFGIFSLLLISPYGLQVGQSRGFVDISFIIYIYALIISIYSSTLFFNAIRSMGLLDPVSQIPFSGKRKAVFISWFIYSGSTSFFVVIPPLIISSIILSEPGIIPLGIAWAAIFILMGYSIGSFFSAIVSGRGHGERSGIFNTLKGTLRVVLVLVVFAVFEIGIFMPNAIPNIIPSIIYPLNRFVPLASLPYILFLGNGSQHGLILDILSTFVYLATVAVLVVYANGFAVRRILGGVTSKYILEPDRTADVKQTGFIKALLIKDIRIVARHPQSVILLFIPVVFVFPTILSVVLYGSPGGVSNIGTYFSLVSILIICSSFYSLILMVAEGNGIETLNSLPLSVRDMVYSKSLFGLLVFSLIIVPVTLVIMGGSATFSPYEILVPANLILGFSFSSIFNIRRLVEKLPKDASTVNFYSFGGGLFIASMFVVTAIITLIPVILSVIVTIMIFHTLSAGQYYFYLTDSIVNFIALVLVITGFGAYRIRDSVESINH